MSVTISDYEFDYVLYDPDRDVLNLGIDDRRGIAEPDTPEGHFWVYDSDEVIGLVLIDPRKKLEREGGIYLTLPSGERVRAVEAEPEVA